ncbi:MAG: tRNA pseudouridine(55) synthase TruB [Clostridia bacterium]
MTDESGFSNLEGFAVIDKPTGLTSYSLLGKASRKLGSKVKAGHAGTLDSFASGVLVCLFGRYTRMSDIFMATTKSYDAVISFGVETDTLDPEGQAIARAPVPDLEALQAALPAFMGKIMQVPPVYSALHVDGERAYERVRKGQAVVLPPRPVTLHRLQLKSFEDGKALISVDCSKGTYIRSLARDIALACGSRGHLVALRRTAAGPFSIKDSVKLDELDATMIRHMDAGLAMGLGLECRTLEGTEAKAFSNGLPMGRMPSFAGTPGSVSVAVFDTAGEFLGIAAPKPSPSVGWRYAFVLEQPR